MTSELLNSKWTKSFQGFNQLIVGFSGGLDSTVLLHVLASCPLLRARVLAVHINHQISSKAISWEKQCKQFCANLNIPFMSYSVQFNRAANVEEEARKARYAVFSSLLKANDCLILGHHLQDQAETLLLQLFRGAGVDGLSAMLELQHREIGAIARPFLACSKEQLHNYAIDHQLEWIDDESNLDSRYSRNYLRHEIMPLIAKKWPGVVTNLARSASHCQQAQINLRELATYDSKSSVLSVDSLSIKPLVELSPERISNVLRFWLKNNKIKPPSTTILNRLINELMFASPDAKPLVSWGGIHIRRYQECLYIDKEQACKLPQNTEWTKFPEPIALADGFIELSTQHATQGINVPENTKITIRFREGGEQLFWHGQTKQLKKLFQEWAIPPWRRDSIPLIYFNDQLAAVVGYAISDSYFSSNAPSWIINY